jgi:NAD(P)-dependent dehydrogenase (short-subunit alcohol dehydrogenase family)
VAVLADLQPDSLRCLAMQALTFSRSPAQPAVIIIAIVGIEEPHWLAPRGERENRHMELPRTPSLRLDGRRALVTGAGRGIGLACAAALAQAGAHVVLVARTASEVNEVAESIRRDGGTAENITLDITDLDAATDAIAGREAFDILVNNAGTNRPATFLDVTAEDFDYMVALNLRAAFFVAQTVARRMVESGKRGSIINISSDMGLVGGPNRTVYCSTKHGMEGMTKLWRLTSAHTGFA